jgi:hypothetical protein
VRTSQDNSLQALAKGTNNLSWQDQLPVAEPPAAAELVCQVSRQDAPQAAAAAASTDAAAAAGGQAQDVAHEPSSQAQHEERTGEVEQVRKGPPQLPQWQGQGQEQATPIKYLGTSLLAQPRILRPPKQQSGLCRQQQQQQQQLQQQRQSSCSSIAVAADNMDCINAGTSSSSSGGSGWDTCSIYTSPADANNWDSADSSNSSSASNRRQAVKRGEHKLEYEVRSSSHLVAFTDGSCHNNGRRTGVGAYAVVFPHARSHTIASPLPGIGTSIRAELQAAIHACETADLFDPGRTMTLIIYTDSLFVIKAVPLGKLGLDMGAAWVEKGGWGAHCQPGFNNAAVRACPSP